MGVDAVAITAAALLTPLGGEGGADESWEKLCAGERVGAEDGEARVDARVLAGTPDYLDKSIRMGIVVARRALDESESESDAGNRNACGVFAGTSKGPVYTMLAGLDQVRCGVAMDERIAEQVMLGAGAMGVYVARELGLKGGVHTSVAACSSGMHALHRAMQAVRGGKCERAVVVAADASLHELFEGSFSRLGVLAPKEADGVRRCEPFGKAGRGFFLSEAAAAVVLERAPKREPVVWLEDLRIGGDGTHMVAIDEETKTLRGILRSVVGVDIAQVAFVHAHATGTGHDRHELAAIRSMLPETAVFSTKGQLGHSLGAAGLVSLVISALAHKGGRMPDGRVVERGRQSVTIAQGFGGHVAVARLCGL